VTRTALLLFALFLQFSPLGAVARAEGPKAKASTTTVDALAGRVILSAKDFPHEFSSEANFLRTMRRMHTTSFRPSGKTGWDLQFLAFFPVPLDESICELHLFDVTEKQRGGKSQHVETRSQFVGERGRRTLQGNLRLPEPPFKGERRYRLIVARASDRGLLAEAEFVLRGQR